MVYLEQRGMNNGVKASKAVAGVKATWSVHGFFYCKIMLMGISYNYCIVMAANKCFNEIELTS